MVQCHSAALAVFFLITTLGDVESIHVRGRAQGAAAFLSPVPCIDAQREQFTVPGYKFRRCRKNEVSGTTSSDLRLANNCGDPDDRRKHQGNHASSISGSVEQQADVSIGVGSSLTIPDGVLSFPTTLFVEGSVSGKIDCAQPKFSPGTRITVARTGTITGDVACAETVEVYGKIVGRIECKFLTAVSGAEIIGDVVCGSV